MKKIAFALIAVLLFGVKTIKAQEELSTSEPISSGCLTHSRGAEESTSPTIILTKEGSILSVQLLNYVSNCGTTGFDVTSNITCHDDDGSCFVTISVDPVIPVEMWCECPFNVSFTVRDLEPSSFYLDCWWYKGQVELTEGEPLVLEYKVEDVTIDGIWLKLLKVMHIAFLMDWTTTEDELHIPSEVNYEGEAYTVMGIHKDAFWHVDHATKVTVPKTVKSMDLDYDGAVYANPFRECKALEWIEVEDGCPLFSSVDGVLFAEDKTMLLGYPNASPRESYTVPEGVTYIRSGAFHHNMYLRKLVIPEEVTYLGWHLFSDTKSLEELYIRGILEPECMSDLFDGMDTKVVVYVQPSEVERYKAIYQGPVYPLPDQNVDDMADVKINEQTFPDENFRNWVLSQEYGKDGKLTKEEIAEVTFMNLFPQNIIAEGHIKSLKGIEYFTAVTKLVCSRNELMELDLSKNTELTWLECYGNHLTELDLSKNTELIYLECNANELTVFDVSCCNKLTELYCNNNKLTTLNVSGCNALTILKCYSNQLTVINLSGCTSLATMWGHNNHLSALNVLDCTSLSTLWCENNQLTQLDVSKNTRLTDLRCSENQLTQLDVSKNTELTELRCNENQLSALDLSRNKVLTSLRTYHNPIKGEAMDALIESLPTVSRGGWCCVLSEDEVGVVTTTQVEAAKLKGWTSYYWNEAAKNWMEYVGSETTQDDYRPMLKDGKVWNCYYSNGFSRFKMVFYLDGDSIVDGDRCFKMYLTMTEMETGTNLAKDGYYGLFLEKDGKVYEMRNGSNSWTQLYDFTMKVGDVRVPGKDYSLTVKAIDSVYVAGQVFRRMTLNTAYYYYGEREDPYVYDGYWVEGVGSPSGPTIPNNCYTPGGSNQLLSCYEDGECIFADNDFWRKGGEDSETYKPIFQEGLTWKMEYQKDSSPESRCKTLVLINSTLIDDIPYKRVYTQEKAGDSDDYIWTPQEYWIGEKDGRVYYYRSGWHDHYTPIMDFSLSVGDSLVVTYVLPDDFERNIHELQTYRVVAVSDTVIDSSTDKCPRRCVYVEGKYGDEKDCWVEGIGSLKYGINVMKIQGSSDTSQSLLSCTRGAELLYYRSQEVNEISNHSVVTKSDSAKGFLFDLQGRQLQSKPERGVYIQDGRKVVIK